MRSFASSCVSESFKLGVTKAKNLPSICNVALYALYSQICFGFFTTSLRDCLFSITFVLFQRQGNATAKLSQPMLQETQTRLSCMRKESLVDTAFWQALSFFYKNYRLSQFLFSAAPVNLLCLSTKQQ